MGLAVARAWILRRPGDGVLVVEKEPRLAAHASGRNSGVLHAGFNYAPGSLKARFSREGTRRWKAFCRERGLPLRECGKLLLATRREHLEAFPLLLERARRNGVALREIDGSEACDLEPRARGLERALHAPETATVDPGAATRALARTVEGARGAVETGVSFVGVEKSGRAVRLSDGRRLEPGFTVNAAGLHADRVARAFGFSRDHRILPFRGRYLLSSNHDDPVRMCLYPVPDVTLPFLGVHLTATPDGRETVGPSARPALWREQYAGLRRFRPGESAVIAARQLGMLLRNRGGFLDLAREALRSGRRSTMLEQASRLARGVHRSHYRRWGRPGIRAQLVDARHGCLEMDFRLEGDERSLHVLNAVSPGFTCALPFGEHVVARVMARSAV